MPTELEIQQEQLYKFKTGTAQTVFKAGTIDNIFNRDIQKCGYQIQNILYQCL